MKSRLTRANRSVQSPSSRSELGDLFLRLHRPSIPVDAISYKEFGGQEWQREGDALWKKRLGKKLCIIDLDDRAMDRKGEIWSEDPLTFDNAHGLSAGILNHYMYGESQMGPFSVRIFERLIVFPP